MASQVAENGKSAPAAPGPSEPEPRVGPTRADSLWNPGMIKYSICTLVTRAEQYEEMQQSFLDRGFDGPDVEFLFVDNCKRNEFDGYSGCNLFLSVARGEYVIICHQDVILEYQGRRELDERLAELDRLDPKWAVCGNAGGFSIGGLAIRISDPHGEDVRHGSFPAQVTSVDENFVVVKRRANISLSGNLYGFHFYGADICVIADILGYTCYAIDFHLRHRGAGVADYSFYAARTALVKKYSRSLRSRWVTTTCTTVFLSGTSLLGRVLSARIIALAVDRVRTMFDWGGL
jgi:hypothetical protein